MSLIASSDRATRIETQQSNDSIIHFTMGGVDYINMQKGTIQFSNTGGCVYLGPSAGLNENYGQSGDNVGIGLQALQHNTAGLSTGIENTALGAFSLETNTVGLRNTALGMSTLVNNINGSYNTAVGAVALNYSTGSNNTALGSWAGQYNTGSGNVFLGYSAAANETGSNLLYIANSSTASPLIYGNFSTKHLMVNDSLTSKYLQMTNGATNGYVLKSDASGNASWVNPTTLTTAADTMSLIASSNRATRIETQQSNDSLIQRVLYYEEGYIGSEQQRRLGLPWQCGRL